VPRTRRLVPSPTRAGEHAFAGRIGGLAIVARSRGWATLRATTSARVRAIFRLPVDAVGNPTEYAAAETNPLIPEFIAHELDKPRLADRWRAVTTRLPAEWKAAACGR
jgi:hypothetical protein